MSILENEALEFATQYHNGQVRKYTNEPYIVHPTAVGEMLLRNGECSEVVAAGYLHDVLEDTEATLDELREKFGLAVASLVHELTNVYTVKACPGLTRIERKNAEHARFVNASAAAKRIKIADRIDNIRSVYTHDKGSTWATTYKLESMRLMAILTSNPYMMRIVEGSDVTQYIRDVWTRYATDQTRDQVPVTKQLLEFIGYLNIQ